MRAEPGAGGETDEGTTPEPGDRSLVTVLVWSAWALVIAAVVATVWLDHRLDEVGRGDEGPLAGPGLAFAGGVLTSATLGAIVVWRSRHVVGWLMVALAGFVIGSGLTEAYAVDGVIADPGSLPAAAWAVPLSEALFWPAFTCLALILVLTPSGRPSSDRWGRLVPVLLVGAAAWVLSTLLTEASADPPLDDVANPMAVPSLEAPMGLLAVAGVIITHGGVFAAVVSLVRRARAATGVERQQLRWVGYGAAVAGVAVVASLSAALAEQYLLLGLAAAILITVLPISVAIAVSRYRLYDLDRVISRSLVDTLLAVAVAAVYATTVAVLGLVAGDGRVESGVAAVVAAMAVAPLRSWVRRTVGRFLFGRRAEPFAVVSGLNERLQRSESPSSALQVLADTVATDLRLPFVTIESPDGTVLAGAGSPSARRDRIALVHQGEDVGSLSLGLRRGEDRFETAERVLLEDLARYAGAAVRAALIAGDLQAARHRLVAAREEERRRLRRDLHDGLGPQLTAVTLKVDAARNLLATGRGGIDDLLAEVRADVRAAIEDIRRVVYELRPPGLDDLGLVGALRQHARACTAAGAPLHVDVTGEDLDGLPAPVEVAAYRIATEAITNAVRHARARRCEVRVELEGDLLVEVSDDGIGLPPRWRAGVGVTAMRERAVELGGSCTIVDHDGQGTIVRARLPMAGVGS